VEIRHRALCAVMSVVAWGALAAAEPRSVWSGVYSAEQAAAGETVYYARCSTCHGDDLAGIERAPAVTGAAFFDSWDGKTLRQLFDRVAAMPPTQPVTPAEAADVLAFLLRAAEMPSGTAALPVERARLAEIRFDRRQP
jgi:S-disulfanyl-L-cysteine oxidoreductase SoxD